MDRNPDRYPPFQRMKANPRGTHCLVHDRLDEPAEAGLLLWRVTLQTDQYLEGTSDPVYGTQTVYDNRAAQCGRSAAKASK